MKKFFYSISLLILMLPAVSCQKDSYGVDGTTPLPEAVDLGLPSGIKWASFNLGAAKEYEYGDYYAWAETEAYYTSLKPLTWKSGKENGYNWPSYSWCNGSFMKLTKYCPKNQTGSWDVPQTEPDGLVELQPSDDVAHVKLGGKWRIPTLGEIDELLSLQTNNDYIWLQGAVATDENGKEESIIRTEEFLIKDLKTNKVLQISQEIGKVPVLSFGNSGGDAAMHNYCLGNPLKSAAFMLIADDPERDHANREKALALAERWRQAGYHVISMRDDFKTIYGPGVRKVDYTF